MRQRRRVDPGLLRHGLPDVPEHGRGHQIGPAQRRDPQVRVGLGPDRIVDLGERLLRPEDLDAQLGGHHVAVVALGQGQEQVGILGAGAAQHVLVGAVAPERRAAKPGREAVEGGGREVHDQDLPAGAVQLVGDAGADPAAPDDHGFHAFCSSGMASRITHTAHGAFRRM